MNKIKNVTTKYNIMLNRIKCFFISCYDFVFRINRDIGKCTKCNNGIYDNCTVGTRYAKQGETRICYEGELWQPNES